MARITWLGENKLHENGSGPSSTTWAGLTFPINESVEVADPVLIRKAKGNPFFKVEGVPGRPPNKVKDDGDQNAS